MSLTPLHRLKDAFAESAPYLSGEAFEEKFLDCQAKLEEAEFEPAALVSYAGELRGLCAAAIVRIRALENDR